MSKQIQKKSSKQEVKEETPPPTPDASVQERAEALKKEMDDLLDEIDGVLETDAEEFVAQYVQKGGE